MTAKAHNEVTKANVEEAMDMVGQRATFGDVRHALRSLGHSDRDLRLAGMAYGTTGRVLVNKPITSPKRLDKIEKEKARIARMSA